MKHTVFYVSQCIVYAHISLYIITFMKTQIIDFFFFVWHIKWEWKAEKQVAISLSVRLNYEISFFLSFWTLVYSLPNFFIIGYVPVCCDVYARVRAFVRLCTSISNCKMDAKQSKYSEFGTEVQPGVLTITYEREINKRAIAERTCNENKKKTPKRTHKYESNERERERKNSQLTMILNGLEQWQSQRDTHTHSRTTSLGNIFPHQ